jgi:glycosyltransferase involved in cell wall biosynthesis
MYIGCPLVATGAGALPEIIQDGVNGLLRRPDDLGDLAAKLSFLLNGPAAAELLGRQAAVDCRQRYSSGLLAARSADYHRRLLVPGPTRV